MNMKRVNQGLSLMMSLLLCVTSFNFSLIANAQEADGPRIIGFNQLDESIASQTLQLGASIDDVVFPSSLKATVETVEEVEVKKLVEKPSEEVKEEPEAEENAEEVDPTKPQTEEEATDDTASEETSDEGMSETSEEVTEDAEATNDSEDSEITDAAENVETSEETVTEPEPTEENVPEESSAAEESSAVEESNESAPEASEESGESEPLDTGFIDFLFPAIVAHAEELEEDEQNTSPTAGAMSVGLETTEPEYETVIEKQTVQSEITIEDVTWETVDGSVFDGNSEATYVFTPVFSTTYTVNAAVPSIKVNIVKADSKFAFEQSQVVDGVRILVKADEGVFPEGATLSVSKVYGSDLEAVEAAVDEVRDEDKNTAKSYTFDIKILDKDGNEIEPDNSKGEVKVSFTLDEVADVNLETDVYHVSGEVEDLSVDKLDATETAETTVEAVTDGFSFYTVNLTYNQKYYLFKGGSEEQTDSPTTVKLADILAEVGLEGEVTNASTLTDDQVYSPYFTVSNGTGEWKVTLESNGNFTGKLIVTINNIDYEIILLPFNLMIDDDLITRSNASGEGWAYDYNTNTLNLNGCTSIQTITCSGDLIIDIKGTNAIKYLSCYDLLIKGDGSLSIVNSDDAAINSKKNINITGGSVSAKGAGSGIVVTEGLTITGGTLTAIGTGQDSRGIQYFAWLVQEVPTITIGSNATSVSITGTVGATNCNVINNLAGTGWTDTDDTEEGAPISVSIEEQQLANYKKIQFPVTEYYPLWVGGVQVSNVNATNIDGSSKVSYDAENNILTLNGYEYEGYGYNDADRSIEAVILYNGDTDLTIDFKGNNNLKLNKSTITNSIRYVIYGQKGFIFKSSDNTGTLDLSFDATATFNDSCMAIYSYSGAIKFLSGTVKAKGGNTAPSTAAHSSGVVSNNVSIEGGTVYATGGDLTVPNSDECNLYSNGIEPSGWSGTVVISKGKLEAKGGNLVKPDGSSDEYYFSSMGVATPNVELGNADFIASGNNRALFKLKNSISGKGGDDLGSLTQSIAKSDTGVSVEYKAVMFTAKLEPEALSATQAFNVAHVNFAEETVSPETGYEVSSSNESYEPVTSLTSIIDSASPTIYVRQAETELSLASPWTALSQSRPEAPSTVEGGKELLLNTTSAMEYKLSSDTAYNDAADGSTSVKPGTYDVRKKATQYSFASKPTVVKVLADEPEYGKLYQEAPDVTKLKVTKASAGQADAAIIGVTTAMEYSSDNGTTWTKINSNVIAGLSAGTYLVRYAETDTYYASDSAKVVIEADATKPEVQVGNISVSITAEDPNDTREVSVTIERGNTVVSEKTLRLNATDLTASFENLEIGNYNVVCKTIEDDGMFTETKLLTVENGKTSEVEFTVLKGDVKAVVTVEDGAPAIAVDGLGDLISDEEKAAAADGKKSIKVELIAQQTGEDTEGVSEIKRAMSAGQVLDSILDLSLFKTVTDLGSEDVGTPVNIGKTNSKVLEIAIPYVLAVGKTLSIIRYHINEQDIPETQIFTKLGARMSSEEAEDGYFFYDKLLNYLYLYASGFSTYAIALEDENTTPEETKTDEVSSSSNYDNTNTNPRPKLVTVYRLFNTKTGEHFYTANKEERDLILEKNSADGWTDEGVAFETAQKTSIPVYRVFDMVNGNHIFTIDAAARDLYIANGYRDEGIAWYAPATVGRKVYKLTDAKSNKVTYTTSKAEADMLIEAGFTCEDAEFVVY